jgi:hypothetical protein
MAKQTIRYHDCDALMDVKTHIGMAPPPTSSRPSLGLSAPGRMLVAS